MAWNGAPEGYAGDRTVRLDDYRPTGFNRGRPPVVEALWLVVSALFVASSLPGSRLRIMLLRLFGARIGQGVVIKPRVRIKFPWKLEVGDHTWLGEGAWIDNLARVRIGANCCVSQEAYLCTGSHEWSLSTFDLITAPITIKDCAWIAARAVVAPGVTVPEGAVVGLGSVARGDLRPWTLHAGIPAVAVRERHIIR